MKILTVLGTRPEIIRLSRIIPLLDKNSDHKVVYTGQNYDKNLNDIFFEDLKIRKPDYILESKAETPMGQIAKILVGVEEIIIKEKPDRLLILGDTNSALVAIVAKRLGVKVFHMEAGNRCFDDCVPEEINRRIIDHSSDILLPYTVNSRDNLLHEGVALNKVYVTGNPIFEVLNYYKEEIDESKILEQLKLEKSKYFLVTLHRAENVNDKARLDKFLDAFKKISETYQLPIIYSLHPHTKAQLEENHQQLPEGSVTAFEPFGLFDFVNLEKNAYCVLSDSGTVQEECAIFQVPNVTLRDVTERPETIEAGSNFIAGSDPHTILQAIKLVTSSKDAWQTPIEYLAPTVSQTIVRILTSYWQ